MDYIIVSIAALLVAGMTLYSGFGLGTLLMPVFAIFFPVPTAVASTAAVHLANNLFRIGFTGRHADWRAVAVFGLPAALSAFGGAFLLVWASGIEPVATYHIASREFSITVVKLVVAALIAIFAVLELRPGFSSWQFSRKYLALGGMLSGFFGGLSGHQGALRSAFLVGAGLTSTAFVGTASVASLMVDVVRLGVYGASYVSGDYSSVFAGGSIGVVATAIVAAFLGTYFSSRFLKSVTMSIIRKLVGILLAVLAVALATGIV